MPGGSKYSLIGHNIKEAYTNWKMILNKYLHRTFKSLLYIKSLPHDCRVEFPLKSQQIHVSLRLWYEITYSLR